MPSLEKATIYILESQDSKEQFEDSGWLLDAPQAKKASLIRAIYQNKIFHVLGEEFGIYRFSNWLPIHRMLKGSCAPITYKSEGLSKALGLSNLYITFSGYWPAKGIMFKTCSFKETEAYSVCGRLSMDEKRILVVASAGNTARAFAKVCSDNNIPLLLSVPEDNINALWFDEPIKDNVKLICTKSGGDYFDAIHLSNIACELDQFFPEGGAKNVARRDGMGTTVLSAAHHIGRIPDYYFQAVGSGTGAIAAWEANLRLAEDGNYGSHKMKLMLSQNKPFTPIYNAWKADSRALLPLDDDIARRQVEEINAKVLSNRKPPYSIIGGIFDAMKDAGGDILLASNDESIMAANMFLELEGNDIHPAAAVATASLMDAVRDGRVDKDTCIMLNITGGGEERFKSEHKLHYLKPRLVFDINPDPEEVKAKLAQLF